MNSLSPRRSRSGNGLPRIEAAVLLRVGHSGVEHLAWGGVTVAGAAALKHEIVGGVGVIEAEDMPEFMLDGLEPDLWAS